MKLISNALSLFIIADLTVMVFHGKQTNATDLSEDDLECLVRNVYHESRNQSLLGQAAVAHVTLSRVKSPLYPDSVCGVVWQKGQFSWTEDGKSDRMKGFFAQPLSCRARHDGDWAKNPMMERDDTTKSDK